MSDTPLTWRVTALEWLSHVVLIEAPTEDEARDIAQRLWETNSEHEQFRFKDSGLDGFEVEEC
jgi:hypothetical protein